MELPNQQEKLEYQKHMLIKLKNENKILREANASLNQQNMLFVSELNKRKLNNSREFDDLLKENQRLKEELSVVYNSRGWKAVKCYWFLMDKTVPRLLFSPIKAIISCCWRKK